MSNENWKHFAEYSCPWVSHPSMPKSGLTRKVTVNMEPMCSWGVLNSALGRLTVHTCDGSLGDRFAPATSVVGLEIGNSYRPMASIRAVARQRDPCLSSSTSSLPLIVVKMWMP